MAEHSTEVVQGAWCYISANKFRTFGVQAGDGAQ